jgi:hypothetical protein
MIIEKLCTLTADFNKYRLTAIESGKPANYFIIDNQLISFTSNQIRGMPQYTTTESIEILRNVNVQNCDMLTQVPCTTTLHQLKAILKITSLRYHMNIRAFSNTTDIKSLVSASETKFVSHSPLL